MPDVYDYLHFYKDDGWEYRDETGATEKDKKDMSTQTATPVTSVRSLSTIAREIRQNWKNVYFGAVPYLDAMSSMGAVTEKYIYDDGRSIVIYFLSNASSWRGDVARRVKAELKAMVKQ